MLLFTIASTRLILSAESWGFDLVSGVLQKSIFLPLTPFQIGNLNLMLGPQPLIPSNPVSTHPLQLALPPMLGYSTWSCPAFYTVVEDLNSSLYACTVSILPSEPPSVSPHRFSIEHSYVRGEGRRVTA